MGDESEQSSGGEFLQLGQITVEPDDDIAEASSAEEAWRHPLQMFDEVDAHIEQHPGGDRGVHRGMGDPEAEAEYGDADDGDRKNPDQLLKYCVMYEHLLDKGFIDKGAKFLLLFIGGSELEHNKQRLADRELALCHKRPKKYQVWKIQLTKYFFEENRISELRER